MWLTQVTPLPCWNSKQPSRDMKVTKQRWSLTRQPRWITKSVIREHPVALVMLSLTDSFIWYWIFSCWHDGLVSTVTSFNQNWLVVRHMRTFILWLSLSFCSCLDQCRLLLQLLWTELKTMYRKELDSLLSDPITVEVYKNISTINY